jgi:hypothetical protein
MALRALGTVARKKREISPVLRRLRVAGLTALFILTVFPHAQTPALAAPRASGQIAGREITLWDPTRTGGALSGDTGAAILSADAGSTGGGTLLFTADPIAAGQLFDRVAIHWVTIVGAEQTVGFEVRTSADGGAWSDWAAVGDDDDMIDTARNEHFGAPQTTVNGARIAQYRVWLQGGDPAALVRVGLTFMDVNDLNQGPLARLVNDVVGAVRDLGASYASAAPVGASKILARADWGADESLFFWTPEYKRAQKAIVHHTAGDDGGSNVAATIRAIYYYHAVTRGWGDIGYNYLVDKFGNIWTGRAGGDHVIAGHAYGWNDGSIGIAAIGTYTSAQPTPAMVGAIANIIALKFTQFGIQPYGNDAFSHKEQRSDGTWINVTSNPPNVQGHRDANYIVGQKGGQTECPGNALYAQLPNIRALAQAAVQNGFTHLATLDPALPKAGLAGATIPVTTTVTNKGTTPIPAGTVLSYRVFKKNVQVAQGGSATIASALAPGGSTTVPVAFIVPPIGGYTVKFDLQTNGIWWNTLYNQPARDIWFRSADWSADWVRDSVPKTFFAGQTLLNSVTVTNDGGRVWPAGGVNPVVLGYRWIDDGTGAVTVGRNFVSLPADVQPGQTITLNIPVTAPSIPNNYTMELDLYKQNEFWFKDKGIPPDPTPVGIALDFHATYQIPAVPQLVLGQSATIPVTIKNTGQSLFPTLTSTPVDLGYHLYDGTGKTVVWDGARTKLPGDLGPGQSVTVQAVIPPPVDAGPYRIAFDLVQEGVSWFSAMAVPAGNATVVVCCAKAFGAMYQPQISTLAASGSLQTVPITLTNTGNFLWPAAGAFPVHLGYHWIDAAGNAVVWDGVRSSLASDVSPGAAQTLQAKVQVPVAPGAYTLKWDLVQEGIAWFSGKGVKTFDQPVVVAAARPFEYGSSMLPQPPDALPTSITTSVPVRIQDLSGSDWDGSVNLSYHWIAASGQVVVWDGLRTSLAGMRAGEIRDIVASVAGPSLPGTYTLRWDVVREGVAWFSGQGVQMPSASVVAIVPSYGALYLPQIPALAAAAGSAITIPVAIMNTGSLTWDPAQKFALAYHVSTAAGSVLVWNGTRTQLAGPVAPGQTVLVNAQVQAPAQPGVYGIQIDLVQEGVTWFSGQSVPVAGVTLTAQ